MVFEENIIDSLIFALPRKKREIKLPQKQSRITVQIMHVLNAMIIFSLSKFCSLTDYPIFVGSVSCETGWIPYQSSCYLFVVKAKKSWEDAKVTYLHF